MVGARPAMRPANPGGESDEHEGAERLAPLTGVLFVILIVVAVVIGGETPSIEDDSPEKIAQFWRDNDDEQGLSSAVGAWATFAFVWFAASVRSVLRAAEPGVGRLSALSFGGALIGAVGFLALLSIDFAAAESSDDVSADVLVTLTALDNNFFFAVAVGFGLFFTSTGLLALRARLLPAWAAWLTMIIGVACITPIGFFALLAGLIWIVVMSIVLYRRGSPAPAAT